MKSTMKKYIIFLFAIAIAFAACTPTAQLDRSKVPAPAAAPKIQIGQYQLITLDNGMKMIVVENHKLPRVSYSINLDIDPVLEGNKAGYVEMAGSLMSAGTKSRTKAQIDEQVDFLGANLSTFSTGVFGNCLKKHSETFLAIMSDVLLNPTFPEDQIEKNRKQTLSGLASNKTDPNAISSNLVSTLNYGKTHPYGEIPTEETVANITREDLVNYYNTYFKPNAAYLIVVGDITVEEAKTQANKYFGSWTKGNVPGNKYKTPTAPKGNVVGFVAVPGAVQSVIDVTYPIDLKPGTQEAITASVLNNILGGSGFQARLMQNLREDKAYTYGAYSSISPDDLVGTFSAGASVRNEVTDSAIVQFLYELDQMVKVPVPDSTLQVVKNIMTGSFARSLERPQTIANFAFNIEKYGLPKDYYETYLQKLNAITPADIQALAQKIIKPNNANITVVGNKEVADKLKVFAASGKVDMYNPDGSPFVELKSAPAGVTGQTVIDNYINAVGGKEKLNSLKSFEQKAKMMMGPMGIEMTLKVKDLSKMNMSMNMNGMELMKQVYDGEKGSMSQMGQSQPMGPDEIKAVKEQIRLFSELYYAEEKVETTLKGMDVLNGEDVYVLEVKDPSGDVSTDYYNVKTGLKMKSVSASSVEGETVIEEVIIMDYKDFGGIKFPGTMKTSAQGQNFDIILESVTINPKLEDSLFKVN
jgi:predicted Zn-dependent peptidase